MSDRLVLPDNIECGGAGVALEVIRQAALYARVSKEELITKGMSLADQEKRLRGFCISRDWPVIELYRDDGASGKTLDRPALQQLKDDAEVKRFDAVCVLKLDRLTRSVRDLGNLLDFFEKHSIALISLNESFDATTAAGKLMMNLLGSVAQWEREAISERTISALRYRRNEGLVYSGQIPYGFVRVGMTKRLEPVERELAVVKRIYVLRAEGHTLRAIADALNTDRIKTKKGRTWAPEQIRYMLGNELYVPYLGDGAVHAWIR